MVGHLHYRKSLVSFFSRGGYVYLKTAQRAQTSEGDGDGDSTDGTTDEKTAGRSLGVLDGHFRLDGIHVALTINILVLASLLVCNLRG